MSSGTGGRDDGNTRSPKADDFSAGSVERVIWSEALQHPATLYPAGVAILGAVAMGALGFNRVTLGMTLFGSMISLGSIVYNYFIRGEDLAREHIAELHEQRRKVKEDTADDIAAACTELGFTEGLEAVNELRDAHRKLEGFLNKQDKNKSAQRFAIMAEDSYQEGLQLLQSALATVRVLGDIDDERLESELRILREEGLALEKRIAAEGDHLRPQHEAVQTRMNTLERRLTLYRDRRNALAGLMAQCEVLEAALETAYLELVDLVGAEVTHRQAHHATKLEEAVAAARSRRGSAPWRHISRATARRRNLPPGRSAGPWQTPRLIDMEEEECLTKK